ncbi:hypothetical protein FF36_03976 [Frankia torreyi]|uniref:Uncharacterized protein n=1 Tax=Frankia torreyi TaxID=1856 RepID=A0A0D8BEG3_9ACTN|nr:hypothetical protein FF36_03976 [Frankia torreyi]
MIMKRPSTWTMYAENKAWAAVGRGTAARLPRPPRYVVLPARG